METLTDFLQICIRSPLFGLQACFFFFFFFFLFVFFVLFCFVFLKIPQGIYYMSANSKGSDEPVQHKIRLAWAFAGLLCEKYPFIMCWLICSNCFDAVRFSLSFHVIESLYKYGFLGVLCSIILILALRLWHFWVSWHIFWPFLGISLCMFDPQNTEKKYFGVI